MFDTNDKQMIVSALKGAKAEIMATVASSDAGTLGKQIADLDPATSTNADILAAFDALRAYRLPVIDSTFSTAITELRANV